MVEKWAMFGEAVRRGVGVPRSASTKCDVQQKKSSAAKSYKYYWTRTELRKVNTGFLFLESVLCRDAEPRRKMVGEIRASVGSRRAGRSCHVLF